MQRKNNFLKKRSGFAMLMAIFVIVIIGTLMGLMISMSTQSLKRTTNVYLNEQAVLLAKSATEYAMLAVSGYDRVANNGCINTINATYPSAASPVFNINVNLRYIGFGAAPFSAGCNDYISNINTPESNGTILMDVTVTSDPSLNIGETIRYHRRTLQKL
ncbi:MAG: type II secretion system protein [Campylobacterota bacterium]|nr:type II secretion system protein [Campylobacterota bacterium]